MATNEELRATVRRYAELWTSGKRAEWLEIFSPDATLEDPVGGDVRHGHQGLGEFWDLVHTMADELELVITGPIRVAAGEAAFPMEAITTVANARLAVDIIDTMTFDDQARITSMRAYWDPTEMRPA